MRIHAAKVSQASGKEAGRVPQVFKLHCNFTRQHGPCSILRPRGLLLPHVVSSLFILRDRGDGGDSQKGTQAMRPSTSVTLMVVLATHRSEGLVRGVHGERHDVIIAPPRRRTCASFTQGQFPEKLCFLNFHARVVAACEKKFSPGNSGKFATSLDVIEGRPRPPALGLSFHQWDTVAVATATTARRGLSAWTDRPDRPPP